ncbi:MAG: VCBS repeat-containing protein [Polyangiaceae bacterium]|nr:VCBS repeat-containing protein [Polyangiaceae bacterium]
MLAPRSRRLRLRRSSAAPVLAVLGLAAGLTLRHDAFAAWPLPPTATKAEAKDPANWPSDPSYAYRASTKPQERESGEWHLFGFVPDRSPGAPALRPEEQDTAAGMSVDLAWRYGIGDDRVLIAVLDSGIKWDEDDLLEKAYLNRGELGKPGQLPVMAGGGACAPLDASKPGVDLFDCNGDGIFTVGDYADHPAVSDLNQNGRVDAGDLILAFSDGVDDDGNGYVDDISGWDFMKDDNDPYDDTRYGHGSSEARQSSAQGNNGIGGLGTCPRCRFVPVRVGDSFIADIQAYSQGVVYGVDLGARVVQEALGTIDMSRYSQAAHDYAWSKGVVVVASMADENARHHNMPAATNHTLPVHAITMMGNAQQITTAESFLAFNTCSNYGAQNYLSASASPCSSEAVGYTSGIAGLLYSAALAEGFGTGGKAALTAGELMQLLMMTTDDIDVAESRELPSAHRWSQPGFDQRFGYGRINANSAVEALRAGRVPPDVDVVRPYWFEVLHKNRLTAPVPILGTVSARRAPSYDVIVEWAPGVQPLEADFEEVSRVNNVPGTTVLGADGQPLAELDARTIDPTHELDSDSLLGENRYTITVRVRSIAHYGGSIGDVAGELRRAYYVHEDQDLVDGFPIWLGASGESSPKLADIDGDGKRDVVVATADGLVHVYSLATGSPVAVSGFPYEVAHTDGLGATPAPNGAHYVGAPAYATGKVDPDVAREAIVATPAVADLTGDGKPEIVVATWDGTIYAVGADGATAPGWPVRLPEVPSCPLAGTKPAVCMDVDNKIARGVFGAPVLADMDHDGDLDVIVAAFDGHVYVFDGAGAALPGWPVRVRYPQASSKEFGRVLTTPAVSDFTGDGIPEVLVGSNERLGSGNTSAAFYLIDGRGNAAGSPPYLTNWPVTVSSFNIFPLVAEGAGNSPVIADIDGNGQPDAIMHGNASAPYIVPRDPGGQATLSGTPKNALPEHPDPNDPSVTTRGIWPTTIFGPDSKAQTPDTMLPLFAQPSAGDLDQDGTPDIITAGGSLSMARDLLSKATTTGGFAQQLLSMWSGKDGRMFPGSPVVLEDFSFFNSQAIADLTGDDYPEVIAGSAGYYLHAVDACGREAPGWPKFTGQWIIATPAVGDLDGDGTLEVVAGTRNGWLYAWHTPGKSDGVIAWESFHHDNRNSGDHSVKLDQGKLLGSAGPLQLDGEGRCIAPEVPDAGTDGGGSVNGAAKPSGGGCDCRVAHRPSAPAWALLPLALGLVLRRRPRRRRAA